MSAPDHPFATPAPSTALARFLASHPQLFILTGAGVSTASGIPDYRDLDGSWKRPAPMTLQAFMATPLARARYWARSMLGWRHVGTARPNAAHRALAELEQRGRVALLVTQNVDGLHQAAGSQRVVDLHGRLDRVRCMDCELRLPRADMQRWLEQRNPDWLRFTADVAPDGDVYLEGEDFSRFTVPPCPRCAGVLKPDVVFFGEGVPRERVVRANAALERSDAMLVLGSSLMVYSGYRFAVAAQRRAIPLAAVNRGHTRADAMLEFKVDGDVGAVLQAALHAMDNLQAAP